MNLILIKKIIMIFYAFVFDKNVQNEKIEK